MSQEYRSVPIEPTIEMIAALGFDGDTELAIGHGAISVQLSAAYAAMLAAAPLPSVTSAYVTGHSSRPDQRKIMMPTFPPDLRHTDEFRRGWAAFADEYKRLNGDNQSAPAGGEVEVWTADCLEDSTRTVDVVNYNDHLAHVTRLTAERDAAIKAATLGAQNLNKALDRADALQAELTKARELIADMVAQQVSVGTDYTADVGRAKAFIACNVDETCGQNAPVAKGGSHTACGYDCSACATGKVKP